jgi:sugar phosphate isomerase/epimerase
LDSPGPDSLAVSTVWASARAEEAAWLLDRMAESGLASLELEYRLTPELLAGVLARLQERGLAVASVHNYCPLPAGLPRARASGDLFNLSAAEPDQRREAVKHTLATLETAARAGARAVVLHLGWVEGLEGKHITRRAAEAGGITPELEGLLAARRAAGQGPADAASFALERLVERARLLGLVLGLENRFHAHQVPDFPETGLLLGRFAGAPVGYWHDVGHAWVRGLAGLTPAEDWLAAYGHALAGCHLHDARGPADHLPPGAGEMDWNRVAAAVATAPVKVLEVAPGPEPGELAAGAELVAGALRRVREREETA